MAGVLGLASDKLLKTKWHVIWVWEFKYIHILDFPLCFQSLGSFSYGALTLHFFFNHKHVFVFIYISYSLKHTCCFWLCRAPIAVHGLSLAAANGLLPSCAAWSSHCSGLSLQSVGSGCSFSVAASTWAQ